MTESTKNERVNKEPIRRQAICKICNGELKDASFIERCQHVFCFLCIQKHAVDSNKCPVCDKEFTCYLSNISNNLQCQMFYVKKPTISVEEITKEKVESCPCNCRNHQQNTACNHKFCRLCFQRSFLKLNECSVCYKRLEELITNEDSKTSTTTLTSQSDESDLEKEQPSSPQSAILTYASTLHKVRSKPNGQTELTEKYDNRIVEEARKRNIEELITNENCKKSTTTLTSQSNEYGSQKEQLSSPQSAILKYASTFHKVRSKPNGQTKLTEKGDNRIVEETRNRNIEELITNRKKSTTTLTSQSNENGLQKEQLSPQSAILTYASNLHKVRSKPNGQTELTEKGDNRIVEETRNRNIEELITNRKKSTTTLTSQSNENGLQKEQLSSPQYAILKYASTLHKVRSKQKQLNRQTELSGKDRIVEETRNKNVELSSPISNRTSAVLDQNANVCSKSTSINSRMKSLDEQLRKTFVQIFNPNVNLDERIRNVTPPDHPSSSANDETPGQSKDINFGNDKINSSERQLDVPVQQMAGLTNNRDEQSSSNIHISSNEVQKDLDLGLVIELPKTNSENDRVDVAILQPLNENAELDDRGSNENDDPNHLIVSETLQQSEIVSVCETNTDSCETIAIYKGAILEISDDSVDTGEQNLCENGKEIEPSFPTSNVIPNQVINADLCTDPIKSKPMTEQLNILYLKMKKELAKLDKRSSCNSNIYEPNSSIFSEIKENDSRIDAPDKISWDSKKLEGKSKSRQNKRAGSNHDPRHYKRPRECCCTEIECKCMSLVHPASVRHPHPKSISTCMSLAHTSSVSHPKSISTCMTLAQPASVSHSYPKSVSACMTLAQPTSVSHLYSKSISVCMSSAQSASVSHPHSKSISARKSLAQPASVSHSYPKSVSACMTLAQPTSVSHPYPKSVSSYMALAQPASASHPHPKSVSTCMSLAHTSSVSHPKPISTCMTLAQPVSVSHSYPKSVSSFMTLAQPTSVSHPHSKSISACKSLAQPASASHPHPKSISVISNQGRNKEFDRDDEVIQGNFCVEGSYSIRRHSSPSKPPEIKVNTTYQGDCPATELMQLMGGYNESRNSLQRMLNSDFQDCNVPANNYANQRQYPCMYQGPPVQPLLYANQGPYAPPGQYTIQGPYTNPRPYANPGPYTNNLGHLAIQRPYMNPLQNRFQGSYSNPGPYVNTVPFTPPRANSGSCIQLVQNKSTVQYFTYF